MYICTESQKNADVTKLCILYLQDMVAAAWIPVCPPGKYWSAPVTQQFPSGCNEAIADKSCCGAPLLQPTNEHCEICTSDKYAI